MNTLLKTGTIGLAGLVTAGLVAWPAMTANASDDQAAAKRDDDTQVVVTTVDDDDDDDTGLRGTNTRTRGGGAPTRGPATTPGPGPTAGTTTAATARSVT